ncbi:MAG: hypothetical protein K940chlam9_00136 [Chlamydiae bacterium]|nr:hypothetical protein [Chlamydiota bacterium]
MTPFLLTSSIIFGLAIFHTLLTPQLRKLSDRLDRRKKTQPDWWKHYHFYSEIAYLLSEVEVVFGIWLIPLFIFFTIFEGWEAASSYLKDRNYSHALYIMVVLVVVGSRPIISFAERICEWVARIGKDSPGAWWVTILTVGPLLGAILKEPGAMALSSILLSHKFYPYPVSSKFKYATLGLLFANVSVGGMLTTFSSRSLFIVADAWGWDWKFMLTRFGWKVVLGMGISTGFYYFLFRKEFKHAFPSTLPAHQKEEPPPFWITLVHLIFLTLIVVTGENAPLFMGIFILFLGFWRATTFFQGALHLQSAILIGFFFASLILHGELQGWWITPLLQRLSHFAALEVSYLLSAFVDNAVVSYLTLEVPGLDEMKKYLLVAGAMSAGALTVIANAPNPIGHAILRRSFPGPISFLYLFFSALTPSLIYLSLFWTFR